MDFKQGEDMNQMGCVEKNVDCEGLRRDEETVGNEDSKISERWESMGLKAQEAVPFLHRKKGISSSRPVFILSLDQQYQDLQGCLLKSRFLGLHFRPTESRGLGPQKCAQILNYSHGS